jgi:hypothetical protein
VGDSLKGEVDDCDVGGAEGGHSGLQTEDRKDHVVGEGCGFEGFLLPESERKSNQACDCTGCCDEVDGDVAVEEVCRLEDAVVFAHDEVVSSCVFRSVLANETPVESRTSTKQATVYLTCFSIKEYSIASQDPCYLNMAIINDNT